MTTLPKWFQPIGLQLDDPLTQTIRKDLQLRRDPVHGYFVFKAENCEKGHEVFIGLDSRSGNLRARIKEPATSKTKDFFFVSSFSLSKPFNNEDFKRQVIRLMEHMFSLTDSQCHTFLYPDENKKERKKKDKT